MQNPYSFKATNAPLFHANQQRLIRAAQTALSLAQTMTQDNAQTRLTALTHQLRMMESAVDWMDSLTVFNDTDDTQTIADVLLPLLED